MIVTVDIPAESMSSFLALCDEQGIEIHDRADEGPAGGNPRFRLGVHDAEALSALGAFY